MDEKQLLQRIQELVDEEHRLRQQLQDGQIDESEEHARLRQAEEQLDQAWDLLRQRRARRDAGLNPDDVDPRPVPEVEDYEQ
ncbi:uncharacterized protein DUF2630 [Kineococcus xinjiangensis]|uniref:Uncharacterized protein DUF2630 n=1 Tax=Kineococcus xinjiangensis TaxID=512762 RepID=A0A2S6IDY5_9ACTN|nr:DUF2630 family protein [Kineococcus xinjiangensis]PPK92435.1 uncharacterized protein DUF2630 [Kineococcus xinjiangensis]